MLAGISVVKWHRTHANGGSEEIYLTPSLDCMVLKAYVIFKNVWRLPTFVRSLEVTSVELGEPNPDLFALPSEYRVVEDPRRRRLLEYIEANRGRGAVKPAP
ncbi:MAG: hypothetical protein ACRD7E_21860 [Bryobacteraceae bacterium]